MKAVPQKGTMFVVFCPWSVAQSEDFRIRSDSSGNQRHLRSKLVIEFGLATDNRPRTTDSRDEAGPRNRKTVPLILTEWNDSR